MLKSEVSINNEIMNIIIVKKYLFISLKSKFILVNNILFIKILLGLLKDKIWLIEYLNKEYTLINLKPELVEKKDPPIITKSKNTKFKLDSFELSEKPIFEILLVIDRKLFEKSLLKKKKRKKTETINIK